MSEMKVWRTYGTVVRPHLNLADGTTASVQASHSHNCTPRNNEGPYSHVEVGFPSVRPEPWSEWAQYAEDPSDPTRTVYSYVPIELVAEFILIHNQNLISVMKFLELS
mgnify:CR=1 FL=1